MKVFVYGTLKSNCRNNDIIKRAGGEFLFPCITTNKYPMFDLGDGFPYIQDTKGIGKHIEGELWKVPNSGAEILNEFEGVPTLYKNGRIDIEFENIKINAYCYFKTKELSDNELENITFIDEWLE